MVPWRSFVSVAFLIFLSFSVGLNGFHLQSYSASDLGLVSLPRTLKCYQVLAAQLIAAGVELQHLKVEQDTTAFKTPLAQSLFLQLKELELETVRTLGGNVLLTPSLSLETLGVKFGNETEPMTLWA